MRVRRGPIVRSHPAEEGCECAQMKAQEVPAMKETFFCEVTKEFAEKEAFEVKEREGIFAPQRSILKLSRSFRFSRRQRQSMKRKAPMTRSPAISVNMDLIES